MHSDLEKRREYQRAYREKNRAKRREWGRRHYAENAARLRDEYYAAKKPRVDELRRWVWDMKRGPCVDCGRTFDPVCMDFDHRPDSEKVANVCQMISAARSRDDIAAEIAKCDLVCACCHRLRTHRRKNYPGAPRKYNLDGDRR